MHARLHTTAYKRFITHVRGTPTKPAIAIQQHNYFLCYTPSKSKWFGEASIYYFDE